MKVTVLYGGPSAEREVSLVSGKAVIEGLQSMGHEVFGSDVSPENLAGLDRPADVRRVRRPRAGAERDGAVLRAAVARQLVTDVERAAGRVPRGPADAEMALR